MNRGRALGVTLLELMLAVLVIAVLLAIIVPMLAAARTRTRVLLCGSRLEQLGVATTLYLADYNSALPQVRVPLFDGGDDVNGLVFGGKKGQLPLYDVNSM